MSASPTPFSGLAAPLTSSIRRQTALLGLNVVESGLNAPKVTATIVSATQRPGMLTIENQHVVPVDSILSLSVEVGLVDAAGESLIESQMLEVKGRAISGNSPLDEESLAQRRREGLLDDMAEMIVSYLFH